MKISCRIEGFFSVPATKLFKERWEKLYDYRDVSEYINSGIETKMTLSIIAHSPDGDEDSDIVLKSYDFNKTGKKTRRNISFMGNTFQYDETTDEIVCLNKYITI